jgi:hypothetical protein
MKRLRVKNLIGCALLLGVCLLCSAPVLLPRLANHYGFALPLPNGLPNRIHYGGRLYWAPGFCGGEPGCRPQPHCWNQEFLASKDLWPLKQVGEIPVLLGAPIPLLTTAAQPTPSTAVDTVLMIPYSPDCYATYALVGGP